MYSVKKTFIGFWTIVFVFLLSFNCVYGSENTISTGESLVSDNKLVVDEKDSSSSSEFVTYRIAAEELVKVFNKRDSYILEISTPTDIMQYLRNLKVDVPKNSELDKKITRMEFINLFITLSSKVANEVPYETDLIDMRDIFVDIDSLSDEDISNIESIFLQGVLSGVSATELNPDGYLTLAQLDIISNRILSGYNRNNLLKLIDSCYTLEERNDMLNEGYIRLIDDENYSYLMDGEVSDRELQYKDLAFFIEYYHYSLCYPDKDKRLFYTNTPMTVREFFDFYSYVWSVKGRVFKYNEETDNYSYLFEDTAFLSAEEFEYFNANLDKTMLLSECMILLDRAYTAKEELDICFRFTSYDDLLNVSQKYLPVISSLVKENKDCYIDFLDIGGTGYNRRPSDFGATVHESQHENSAKLARAFESRKKNSNSIWSIYWSGVPNQHYYYDYTTNTWVRSYISSVNKIDLVKSSDIYHSYFPSYIKNEKHVKHYNTSTLTNKAGLHGILYEFCSYGIQTRVEYILHSMNLKQNYDTKLDPSGNYYYNSYKCMQLSALTDFLYYKDKNKDIYNELITDTDLLRMMNNIMKDMDNIKEFYYDSIIVSPNYNSSLEQWEAEILEEFRKLGMQSEVLSKSVIIEETVLNDSEIVETENSVVSSEEVNNSESTITEPSEDKKSF